MKRTNKKKSIKINKKNIFMLIMLIMLVIFEIVAFKNSKANKILSITASIIDNEERLQTEKINLEAKNLEKSGYAIILPEYINNKKIDSYYILEKEIHKKDENLKEKTEKQEFNTNVQNSENTIVNDVIDKVEKKINNEIEEKNLLIENKKEEQVIKQDTLINKSIKIPGDTIYLTDEEIKNGKIEIRVLYSNCTKNNQILYEQKIQTEIDENEDGIIDSAIKIEGFMPIDSNINITKVNIEEIENLISQMLTDKVSFKKAYDIKILYNNKEYEPTDFDTNVKVTISGLDEIDKEKQEYKVVHIEKTNTAKEVNGVKTINNSISFPAESFSTYALLLDESANRAAIYSSNLNDASIWNGNVASKFRFGKGTSTEPYLIISGEELAYLAEQVNNGISYDGQYFELIKDIDLNNREWNCIGNYTNSFKGEFDGLGHIIANAKIVLPTNLPTDISSYGIFGSIGDSQNKTVIKNLQIDSIKIEVNANGSTSNDTNKKGYNIGIVVGTIYNNAEIKNVIVNNSEILNNYHMTIRNNSTQIFVGGIAGLAINSQNSSSNPNKNNRYSIENCYANVDINLDIELYSPFLMGTRYDVAAQYSAGGILGSIRTQQVWPKNCLYRGNINAVNAFTGPIFGTLRNKVGLGSNDNYETQFDTLWQGNDAGKLKMKSYYTSYSTNNRSFSKSVESGISTERCSTKNFMKYVQGVNKGLYINNANSMLTNFNNYVNKNSASKYLKWYYEPNSQSFYFKPALEASVNKNSPNYTIVINNQETTKNYTYKWYIDGIFKPEIVGNNLVMEQSWKESHNIDVLVSDGKDYVLVSFEIKKWEIHVVFEKDNKLNTLTAKLEGTGINDSKFNLNDYEYQWYKVDIAETEKIMNGATSNVITDLENGMDYKIVATNKKYPYMTTEGTYVYERTVIFVDENNGNNANDGYTPQTAVSDFETAYRKFKTTTTRNENVIVLIGEYKDKRFLQEEKSNIYNRNVTITGKYHGVDYNAVLAFEANNRYRFLNGDTTFMYLTFDASTRSFLVTIKGQTYFYLQGYSLTMGEGIKMQGYETSNTNQGLIEGNSPAFHMFAGWLRYDETKLPRTGGKILIKSGTYARVLLGGSTGTSSISSITNNNSHNFMGNSLTDDLYKSEITIDIQNSTTPSNYSYDINLLGGGSTCGNIYGDVTLNIKNGNVGRLLGASIGDSSDRPNNWQYPLNTYIGTSTINMTGGNVTEMYGGCLGRNMRAMGGNDSNPIICDSYFYGTVNINISGGIVTKTIYGAGAGGVSGYSLNSTDVYKNYGEGINTVVNINISGGTINADIFGGGYGYTNYLTQNSTQVDGGTLYGNSNINISGSPTINGSIYGGGRGYDLGNGKPNLAKMEGNSNITISGNPKITGEIYGAGMGISQHENMAKLTGDVTININSDLNTNVFGGGNIAKTIGSTNININNGNHLADIYGGGNVGILEGKSNINIKGGNSKNIYGGGNKAGCNLTEINIIGGNTEEVYGGSNQLGQVDNTVINANSGNVGIIYGGNNQGGTCITTNINLNGSNINESAYGGGNQVETQNTNVILNNSTIKIPNIFGGGKSADATNTTILVNGGDAINIFGGSNASGIVNTSNIEVKNGNLDNIYGGNNQGGITNSTNIVTNGGIIDSIYGGGNRANTDTTNVITNNGKINNVFGGANQADVTTTNVNINGGNITNVFGGSNQNGIVTTSKVAINNGKTETVYGGNNLGGKTITSNVVINSGEVTNVYGGGNQAAINTPNVIINTNANILESVYGGGNKAKTETNTKVDILGGSIVGNVYGGGNEGIVTKDTYVHVKDTNINSSVYGGGNGKTAIVYGNTNVIIEGTNTNIMENVFGGGNQAETGTKINDNSLSTVNIVGGNIGKNVYGGANTSTVYGNTLINIGYDTVKDNTLTKGDIVIGGTVFGGGEANASGSEIYDFSFISVTKGIDININANMHSKYQIKGSIFGSGNASSTSGYSNINIKNYGSIYNPKKNISIQRADIVNLDNSAISLSGAKDRTNEYSNVDFTLSRIDELKIKNNSILYLDCGANLLKKFTSAVDENGKEELAKVAIDDVTGLITKNVDNRIYMLEGKNLNIATNEQVTAYGEVNGMTFFGLYTNSNSPSTSTGLYNKEYNNGDLITNAGTFSLNSYVRGLHKANHDITIDGFYSNYDDKENQGYIKTQYIKTTPEDDVYYIWLVGVEMDVTVFDVELTASKYATLGTHELGLTGFSDPNTKFILKGFSAGLNEGISLVDPQKIEGIAKNPDDANSIFGLTIRTGHNGWMSDSKTTFLTENGGTYNGSTTYLGDNSNYTPALNLYLYHSKNITIPQKLGSVKIRLQAQIPKDELNIEIKSIDIIVNMSTALYQDDFYEASITPGEEFRFVYNN